MKITCQACAAKYTIADEKVRGKTVKIKCKKCGASIVASGKEGEGAAAAADAPSEIYWTVNVGEGDQRSLSAPEIGELLSGGYVNADSFAWRDGMTDWLPLAQVPELAGLFGAAPELSGSPEMSGLGQDFGGREIDEDMPTKMERGASLLDMAPGAAPAPAPFAAAPSPFAPSPAPAQAPAPAARAARAAPAGGDLFAPRALEPAAPAPPARPGGNIINDEASGLIDIRNLSASLGNGVGGPPKPTLPQKNALDDVMGLGGQPLFSPAPLMAPPDLNAPPPPPPPAPTPFGAAPGAVPATAGFSAIPAPPAQKKSSAGLIVGVLGLVIAAAAVGALVMSKKGGDEQKTPVAADTKTADPASTAKPAESVAAAATSTVPATAPEGTPAEKADPATTKTDDKKKDDKKAATDPKADDKKKKDEDKKKEEEAKKKEEEAKKKEAEKKKEPDPPPVAAGGGSDAAFDRGAAMSAMGAAANNVSQCKKSDGPTGSGRVAVTFAPSGNVTNAVVNGDPFAGTSVGGCVAAKFRAVKVPPFGGSPVTVNKTFTIN